MVTGPALTEQERELRLRRMKRIPLALLVFMALMFFLTLHRPEAWAGWVHAFAEAGMVGALADWFAVVALFRHPLGLPIPHTAIIPTRKNELGDAMARFISDHFLDAEVVGRKLASVNLSRVAIAWLQSDKGRTSVQDLSSGMLRWGLDALHEERVRKFLSRLSRRQLKNVSFAPLMGHTLDWAIREKRHQDVLTQALRYVIVVLDENQEKIRERVREGSPWWLPGFVDDRILKQMLDRIQNQLFQMSLDPDHPLRGQFNDWLKRLASELRTSPEYRLLGRRLKEQLLENEALQDYLYNAWADLASRVDKDLENPESMIRGQVGDWVDGLADELQRDEPMQVWINQWMTSAMLALVERNRTQISSLISDTVRSWDGQETSRRVELALGRDLQFIRINGTLVGGLVGLVIHAITRI